MVATQTRLVEIEYFGELLVVHVRKPGFAGIHGHIGDSLLCLQQGVDFFFEGTLGNKAVHLNILGLPDTEGAVGCLRLNRRIPPQVVMNHLRGGSQIQAGSSRLQRQD